MSSSICPSTSGVQRPLTPDDLAELSGLIAEQVAALAPELVSKDATPVCHPR
ncbi:hypothetical protein ACWEPM_38000 [Streptomyces sp. NPDC004244]